MKRVRVGPAADVGAAPRLVPLGFDSRHIPRSAIVLRDAGGVLRAFLNECKHLPIPLDGGSGEVLAKDGRSLLCGTHGALYRPTDGYCFDGPCEGESLEALELVEEDGELFLLVEEA